MGVSQTQAHNPIFVDSFSEGLKYGRYFFSRFESYPIIQSYGTQAAPVVIPAVYTAAADQVDSLVIPNALGNQYLEFYQTTAQAIPPNRHLTKGLSIGGDQVENEALEIVPGGNTSANPFAMVVSDDDRGKAVFIRALIEVEDSSGIDELIVGFRKQEAYVVPTAFASAGDALYTDYFGLGFCGTETDPNAVGSISDLNNSGSATRTANNFTWADGLLHQLEVRIVGRRAIALINGVRLGETIRKDGSGNAITAQATLPPHSFSFDVGDTIIPFIFVRQDDELSPVYLRQLEVGQLCEIGLNIGDRTTPAQ